MLFYRTYTWSLLFSFTIFVSVTSATFGLGAIPLTPNDPPVATANATGSYQVGVHKEPHLFKGLIYNFYWFYPASPAAGSSPFVSAGGVKGTAVEDAPVNKSGGPYPLIFFSPGLGAYADAYLFYVQNLASHGYVVISMEHLDTHSCLPSLLYQDLATEYQEENEGDKAVETLYTDWFRSTQFGLTYRPQEIEFGIDTAIDAASNPRSMFYNVFDPENLGMSGHSLGGFYTLVIGGGEPLYCDYQMPLEALNPLNPILANVSICAFPARQALSSPTVLYDGRVKAILPLAAPFFIQESQIARSAKQINIPLMVLTGDDLQLESTRHLQYDTYTNASGPSYFVMVEGTSHYLVADSYQFNPTFASGQLPDYDQTNFFEKAAVYMTYSAAFFDVYLKGDQAAVTTLHTISSPFVADLEYHD